ncbi:hypothetical protein LINPERPRIM_LOCUS17996 [Linum perenne]
MASSPKLSNCTVPCWVSRRMCTCRLLSLTCTRNLETWFPPGRCSTKCLTEVLCLGTL